MLQAIPIVLEEVGPYAGQTLIVEKNLVKLIGCRLGNLFDPYSPF
jgi:hypothetical protein